MADTDSLRDVIAKAEATFRRCRAMLRSGSSTVNKEGLLAFQGDLARALYFVDHQIIGFKRQRNALIEQKRAGSAPPDFVAQLKRINEHVHAAERVVDYGKAIGDSFAWLFISDNAPLLRDHYAHQRQDSLPIGVGGIGEIEFISRAAQWGSHIALYHGITTFLRLGDLSFVNIATGKIDGMAELKSRWDAKDQVGISVTYIGKKFFELRARPDAPPASPPPHWISEALRRQEERLRNTLHASRPSEPTAKLESAQLEFNPFPLVDLFDKTTAAAAGATRVSPSLVLVGIKIPVNTLADRVLNTVPFDATRIIASAAPEMETLPLAGSPQNSVHMSWLWFPNEGRYRLPFGLPPLLWWPIREDVVEAMASGQFAVLSLFNPAHMVAALRERGFELKRVGRSFEFTWTAADGRTASGDADFFFRMVAEHLISEHTVVKLLHEIAQTITRSGKVGRVRLDMAFMNGFGRASSRKAD